MIFSSRRALRSVAAAAVVLALPVLAIMPTHAATKKVQHPLTKKPAAAPIVKMVTSAGTILIKLFPKEAPISSANFEKLVRKGFYNGLDFHRVETMPEFRIIQGGRAKEGEMGGPPAIKGEFKENGVNNPLMHNAGAVAMARTNDPNSANCQFYICIHAVPQLDGKYAVFGQVIKGLDVADKIVVGDMIKSATMIK